MEKSNAINDFLAIWNAYRAAMRGKAGNVTALKFDDDAISRCYDLSRRLQDFTYRVGGYYDFEVWEPKHRFISALNLEGKIVQHSLCDNALYDAVCRRLITDNYAVQIGKGTHFGLDRLRDMLRHYFFSRKAKDEDARRKAGLGHRPREEWDYADGYVLKGDFSKYFYTLLHGYCKTIVADALASLDDDYLRYTAAWLSDLFIDSTSDPGIPIGNQSSQLIALLYLDWMDHWIKDDLGLPYGRYMDDFFVVHESKDFLKGILAEIGERIKPLGLRLNPKTQIFPLKNGIDFLGYHTYLTETGKVVRKVRAKSIDNMRRHLRKYRGLVDAGRMTLDSVWQSYQSWCGHIAHGNSYHLQQRMDRFFRQLFPELAGNAAKNQKNKEDKHGPTTKPARDRVQDQVPYVLRRTRRLAFDRPEPGRDAVPERDAVHGQDRVPACIRREGAVQLRLEPQELWQ